MIYTICRKVPRLVQTQANQAATEITHQGRLAQGPDYKLYLTEGLVDYEDNFDRANAIQIGDVRSLFGFILELPEDVDVAAYDGLLISREALGEFIASAIYN